MIHTNSELYEVSNAIMIVQLGFLLIILLLHLCYQWQCHLPKYMGWTRHIHAVLKVYRDCKPEIALTVLIFGIHLKSSVVWLSIHMDNKLHGPRDFIWGNFWGLVIGTVVTIIGATCINRVISPFRLKWYVWTGMVISSIAFGFASVLLF